MGNERKRGKKVTRPKPTFCKEESIICDSFPEPSLVQYAVEQAALSLFEEWGIPFMLLLINWK